MRILADLHHAGLFYSFKLLFEDRLGAEVYRPVGKEWFDKGYWDVAKPYQDNPGTINQYLGLDNRFKLVDTPISHYVTDETEHGYQQKALTFQQFLDTDIDIIIASIPFHWITYRKLRSEHKPKAKLIAHMGNMFNEVFSLMQHGAFDNLMASTIDFPYTPDLNTVFYYQEQPLVDFVVPDPNNNKIKSFVHLLPKPEQFMKYMDALPEFEWKAYGASAPNGFVNGIQNVYKEMQDSQYIYHVKPGGDGFGWNWHSAFMNGRPVLTNFSDYERCLGGRLFEDGITGFNLEAHTIQENCQHIKQASHDGAMAHNARKRFMEVVNYENEAEKIKKFFDKLK